MVDEVEIKNVMGSRGVASEATLLLLLDEFRKREGGGTSSRDRTIELFNRSASNATDSFDNTGDAADSLGKRFIDTTKVFAAGARRTEDFVRALAGGEGRLSALAGFLDRTVDTFRSLTSVGASFNNSMIDMISASANSAMEMGDFANFVARNSETIRLLGGTVTEGAIAIGEFSKQLRNSPAGTQLMNMGFTIEDLNDGLVSYIDLQNRLGRGETLRTQNLSLATAEYLEEIDAIAKATGRSREEIMSLGREIAADARVRSIASRLSADASSRLNQNLTIAAGAIPGLTESFFNMASGTPIDDFSKLLVSQVGPAGQALNDLMLRADDMDPAAFTAEFSRLMPQIGDALSRLDPQQLAALGEFGTGLAARLPDLARMGYQMDRTAMMSLQRAQEEASRQNRLTGIFANFENAIISARRFLVDTFLDSALAQALSNMGAKLANLFSENETGGVGWGLSLLERAFNSLAGPNGVLTNVVNWMSTELDEGGSLYEAYVWLTNKIAEVGTAIGVWFDNFVSTVQTDGIMAALTQEFNSITSLMSGWFNDTFGSQSSNNLGQNISNWFSNIFETAQRTLFGGTITTTREDVSANLETARTDRSDIEARLERDRNSLANWQRVLERTTRTGNRMERSKAEFFISILERNIANAEQQIADLDSSIAGYETQLNSIGDTPQITEVEGIVPRLMDKLYDAFFGNEIQTYNEFGDEITKREGGIMQSITQGFANLFQRPAIIESVTSGFTSLIESANNAIQRMLGLPTEGSLWQQLWNTVGIDAAGDESIFSQLKNKLYEEVFGREVTTFNEFGDEITRREGGILQSITNGFASLFERQEIIDSLSRAMQGVFESVSTGFVDFWNGPQATDMKNIIVELFEDIQLRILQILDTVPFVDTAEQQAEIVARRLERAASDSVERLEQGYSASMEDISTLAAAQDVPNIRDLTRALREGDVRNPFVENAPMSKNVFGADISNFALQRLHSQVGDMSEEELIANFGPDYAERLADFFLDLRNNSFANGTAGFKDFGSGTVAMLHGVEAVVPYNSPQGRLLQADLIAPESAEVKTSAKDLSNSTANAIISKEFSNLGNQFKDLTNGPSGDVINKEFSNLGNQIKALASAIETIQTNPVSVPQPVNQSNLITKLEELNTTMKQVVELLDTGVGVQRKTMRGIQGLGSDYYRGVPR